MNTRPRPCQFCGKLAPFQGVNYGGFPEFYHERCLEAAPEPEPDYGAETAEERQAANTEIYLTLK